MRKTSLYDSHNELGAKIVPFAGYEMPLFYDLGIVKEHLWVRNSCGIFDVSHMGQIIITGARAEEMLSTLTPSNFRDNGGFKAKYTVLLNENCGVIDDIIATKLSDDKYFVVINAARKDVDIKWIEQNLANFDCKLEILERSLIAVQGQHAVKVVSDIFALDADAIEYMSLKPASYQGQDVFVSRTGYTGEDGFELSVSEDLAAEIWQKLLNYDEVKPIGLGARDSLRLEMGYPLYGHELSEGINLGESTLKWIVNSEDNFIGKDNFISPPSKKRVGIKLIDKAIARDGMEICDADGNKIGVLTSAAFSPVLNISIGQAIINIDHAKFGNEVFIDIRGKLKKAEVNKTSFLVAKTKK